MNASGMHLVRALVGGLALGLALLRIVYTVIAFGTTAPFAVIAVCVVARLARTVLGRAHRPAA